MTAQHLILAIIVLQIADAASTVWFLGTTNLVEANPVLAKLFQLADPLVVLLVLKGIFAVGIWTFQTDFAAWALWAVAALYVGVVASNVRLIRKAQE